MPVDKRLWMTFPIDFPEHPKIRPLSDAAFRAFVEINGYSRTQDLDGRVPVRVARAKWKPKALKELEENHPDRPTLSIDGDHYVIHNYAEHQQTKAAREAQSQTNSANGKLGGRPRKNRPETDSLSDREATSKQSQSQSQSQSDDVTNLPESSHQGDGPGKGLDLGEVLTHKAKGAGIKNLPKVLAQIRSVVGEVSPAGAIELVEEITGRAKGTIRNVDAYVATACRNSPDEVQSDYDRLDIAAIA